MEVLQSSWLHLSPNGKKKKEKKTKATNQSRVIVPAGGCFKADIKHDYNIYFKAQILSKRQINKYPLLFLLPG